MGVKNHGWDWRGEAFLPKMAREEFSPVPGLLLPLMSIHVMYEFNTTENIMTSIDSPRPKRGLRITRRLGLALPLLLSLGLPGLAQEKTPHTGGTVTFNVGNEPPNLLSATNTGTAQYLSSKVAEGLLAFDRDWNPIPQLATAWSVSDDSTTYRFTLRQGVTWHDGEVFDAEDVKFSILAAKEEHPRGRGTLANVEAVEVIGPHEVEVRFSKPAPYFLRSLVAMETPILAEHVFKGEKLTGHAGLNAPIGTGPFKVLEWQRGSHIIYERNADYWDAGKPDLDRIIVRFVTDPGSATAAQESGDVQVTWGVIPIVEAPRLEALETVALERNGNSYNNSILRGLFNLKREELANPLVRKAISHVIDKDWIIQTVYLNYAQRLDGPIHPDVKDFVASDLPRPEINAELAEKLLDEAGYPRKADGTRFELFIDPMYAAGPQRQIADYIAQQLAGIGIKATVRTQDFPAFVKRLYTDNDFDLAVEPMSNLFDPTVGVQRLYWSKNIRNGVPFSNGAQYISADVDAWLEEAAA